MIIAVLLIVDAVLIGLALNGRAPETPSTASPQGEIVEPEATPSESATPTPEPTEPLAPPATAEPQRVMTALDETTAWRVATGACPEAGVAPELSADAGATWTASDASAGTSIRSVQRLIVSSASSVALIGIGGEECTPTLVRTYVTGAEWAEYAAEVGSAWYIADEGASVHAPGGVLQSPCPGGVAAISVSGTDSAAALCRDGAVSATVDAGRTWSAPTALAGARALAQTGDGYLAAVLGSEGCAGVAIVALDRVGAGAAPVGCRIVTGDAAGLAGRIALSESRGALWLWAGDDLARSSDRGAGWL